MTDMPKEIWANEYNVWSHHPEHKYAKHKRQKYHHDSGIQKRDEIIRDLAGALSYLSKIENLQEGNALSVITISKQPLTKHADDLKEICDE